MDRYSFPTTANKMRKIEKWQSIFKKYVPNREGKIGKDEYQRIWIDLEEDPYNFEIPIEVIEKMDKKIRKTTNLGIGLDEFIDLMQAYDEGGCRNCLIFWLIKSVSVIAVPSGKRQMVQRRYMANCQRFPLPFVLLFFTILQVGTFLCQSAFENELVLKPGNRKEPWRLWTYMLIHTNSIQLAINMALQLLLGIPLEMAHGWCRVALIYSFGVISEGLVMSLFGPDQDYLGASGGLIALLGAHLANLILNWKEMEAPYFRFAVISGCLTFNFVTDFVDTKVNFVGGSLCGFMLGMYLLRDLRQASSRGQKIQNAFLILFAILFTTGMTWILKVPFSAVASSSAVSETTPEATISTS